MAISNEGRCEDLGSLLVKDTMPAENNLANSSAHLWSPDTAGIFKMESERKEQTAASTLPGLQISDIFKEYQNVSSPDLRFVNADPIIPGVDPNFKPVRHDAGSKVWKSPYLDPFKPKVEFQFPDGEKIKVDMPPAERGQRVQFTFVSQVQGGFCLEATAGGKTWLLKESGWENVSKK